VREKCLIFSERVGNGLLVGGRNFFLAGEKRVRSLVEREKCSFFQRDQGMFSWRGMIPRMEREKGSFFQRDRGMFSLLQRRGGGMIPCGGGERFL
jgi:hypothetical protein